TRSKRDWSSDVCSSDLGCMSQRFARELRGEMPEVDAFIGLDQVSQLGEIIEKIVARPSWLRDPSEASGTHALLFSRTRPIYIPRSEERRVGKECRARIR